MNADEDVEDCDWLTLQHKMLQVKSSNKNHIQYVLLSNMCIEFVFNVSKNFA